MQIGDVAPPLPPPSPPTTHTHTRTCAPYHRQARLARPPASCPNTRTFLALARPGWLQVLQAAAPCVLLTDCGCCAALLCGRGRYVASAAGRGARCAVDGTQHGAEGGGWLAGGKRQHPHTCDQMHALAQAAPPTLHTQKQNSPAHGVRFEQAPRPMPSMLTHTHVAPNACTHSRRTTHTHVHTHAVRPHNTHASAHHGCVPPGDSRAQVSPSTAART